MSKKVSLGVAATVTLIAMAVTFSMTMTVSMNMFNNTVSSVKNKERMYNKLGFDSTVAHTGVFHRQRGLFPKA